MTTTPSEGSPTLDGCITIQVGESRFETTIETLKERSDYFAAMFSGRWPIKKKDDGSIFVDGNGAAFAYVMEYLRRGIFPLAHDHTKGHDYGLYARILAEARYFQCADLVLWLEGECYMRCVVKKVETVVEDHGYLAVDMEGFEDWRITSYSKGMEQIYHCPRGIPVHKSYNDCGRQCQNAMKETGPRYSEREMMAWLIQRSKCLVHHEWMTDTG
ncbi:hypothetical protein FQN49_001689 [Arthroderma sp. PD_2]|nr:hypothetical protein FQN49_001689 [Arthroderma sp. PD_2]